MIGAGFLGLWSSGNNGKERNATAEMRSPRGPPPTSPRQQIHPSEPVEPPRGVYLRTHHLQTYLIGLWMMCILAYLASIEKAIDAHQLSPSREAKTADTVSFGMRGTRRRQETVQMFSFAKTILTAIHIPIITATLSSTLPILVQRAKGRVPPNINAEQLFLLADQTWAGAGGWYEALRVRRLSWEWWKLTLLVLAAFAGFPFVTLGYIATSDQYWAPYEFRGAYAVRLNRTVADMREAMTTDLGDWIHRFPQREIGTTRFERIPGRLGPDGKHVYSFYPPADQTIKIGHFVTYIEPSDSEPRLLIANTLGIMQNLQCRALESVEKPKYINVSKGEWKCLPDCAKITNPIEKNMCHTKITIGRKGPSGQFAQIASCGQPVDEMVGFPNKVILTNARIMELEIAIKIDPPYESVSNDVFPPPQNAWSFRAGNAVSGDRYYVDILRCSAALVPGDGIVDSVIRRFMHFIPYGLGLTHETPEIMSYLEQALPEMMNVTLTPALSLLHAAFRSSNYGPNNASSDFNNSLPVWFGVHKPTTEGDRSGDTWKSASPESAQRGPARRDQFTIDNMVRVDGEKLLNAFHALVNSTFITALPSFIIPMTRPGFSYQTDVKLSRGIPVGIAPVVILAPVLLVLYLSLRQWNTPTWTQFLDSFAMFRLGRSWEHALDGTGATEFRKCWQVRDIPGVVGDGGDEKTREVVGGGGKEYVGSVKLGGEGEFMPRVRYA